MKTYARDIMSRELLCVRKGTSLRDALKLLVNSRVTGLPVVDESGKMVGVFSDYDVLSQIHEHKGRSREIFAKPIRYSKKVQAVQEETRLPTILRLFVELRYRRLPVLNAEGQLVGLITRRDLMKLYYYRATLAEVAVPGETL